VLCVYVFFIKCQVFLIAMLFLQRHWCHLFYG
jgi:hypothetical protein